MNELDFVILMNNCENYCTFANLKIRTKSDNEEKLH